MTIYADTATGERNLEQSAASGAHREINGIRDRVVADVVRFGYSRRDKPYRLSSGAESRDYIDGKRVLSSPTRRKHVARAVLQLLDEEGVGLDFDAVGGLTMGADYIALGVSDAASEVAGGREIDVFSVRKDPKTHGKEDRIAGAQLSEGMRVLLVDDVVTTGNSIIQALDEIQGMGATVVFAVALVDRGEGTSRRLTERGIRYRPLITYLALGIEPVPDEVMSSPA